MKLLKYLQFNSADKLWPCLHFSKKKSRAVIYYRKTVEVEV